MNDPCCNDPVPGGACVAGTKSTTPLTRMPPHPPAGWDLNDPYSSSSSTSRESSSSPSRSICSVSSVSTSCDLEYLGQCLQEEVRWHCGCRPWLHQHDDAGRALRESHLPLRARPNPCAAACPPPFPPPRLQHKASVNPRYLTAVQTEMDGLKRRVLVDWLVEVCDEFALRQETLFLAVNIMDRWVVPCSGSRGRRQRGGRQRGGHVQTGRQGSTTTVHPTLPAPACRYLSAQRVRRTELQLVAVTSLWLACKYEEVRGPQQRSRCHCCTHPAPPCPAPPCIHRPPSTPLGQPHTVDGCEP